MKGWIEKKKNLGILSRLREERRTIRKKHLNTTVEKE